MGLGDAEHEHKGAGACDLDFGDEGFDECLAGLIGSGTDDLGDVVGDLGERGCVRQGGFGVERGCQLVAAGGELLAGGAELGESGAD
ncbi:hypothetical protein [Saccharopolyspora sp. CA-218241]|uniref:hypothetical protein n=1 Tax=Saccharopolyspora sp. CA-218241 TaxID=3240027 RepID=UPI003D994D2C